MEREEREERKRKRKRKRGEREKREKTPEATRVEMDDGAEATATAQDQDMANAADKPQVLGYPMDDAVKILMRNATEAFGFAPRDTFRAILRPRETKERHENPIRTLDYLPLKAIVKEFDSNKALSETSRRIVAVHPRRVNDWTDDWAIDFKSVRIAEEVVEGMMVQEEDRLREMYDNFHKHPVGSNFAAWAFKAIVHRLFSNGWRPDSDTPQPVLMTKSKNPPIFSVDPSSSPTHSFASPLRTDARTATWVDFTHRVRLLDDIYSIPTMSNNSLFDSFTINTNKAKATAVISIFQITTSQTHYGSAEGYAVIHRIVDSVRRRIQAGIRDKKTRDQTEVKIDVVYFLVCPEDRFDHEWHMPAGWDEITQANDHRGDCYFIRIPASYLTVCDVYSILTS